MIAYQGMTYYCVLLVLALHWHRLCDVIVRDLEMMIACHHSCVYCVPTCTFDYCTAIQCQCYEEMWYIRTITLDGWSDVPEYYLVIRGLEYIAPYHHLPECHCSEVAFSIIISLVHLCTTSFCQYHNWHTWPNTQFGCGTIRCKILVVFSSWSNRPDIWAFW